jgi:cell division septation protein DedD
MRFGYYDFKESLTERVKATTPQICMALAALFVCLCPLTASAQARRINGYAVQVAALSSQKSADALAQGLRIRGMNAYWVGGMSYGAGRSALHRVRIGNFPTIASASAYAEKLLGAGLLASYAIAAYEPPVKADSGPSWKIHNLSQKFPGRRLGPDLIDVVAAIGSRGWLLLSSESISLTARAGNSALSRELVPLDAIVTSRGWGMNNNAAKVLGAAAPINIVSLPSGIVADTPDTPPPPSASSSSLSAAAPEIGRRELITTTSPSVAVGSPGARSRINSSTSLQGSIEMRGGRMYMTLRNVDPERVFSGVARVSLTDDQKQQDVTPINVTLLPDKEVMFPLDEATLTDGGWILMVYDLNGAARLIRGASPAPPKAPAQAPGATNSAEAVATNPGPEVPPSYVTGVYDTTNWAQPQVPPQIQNVEGQDAAVTTAPSPQDVAVSAAPSVQDSAAGSPNAMPQVDNAPGQVTATLRQIAVTSENVTLELEISAQNPLKNVTVTLRAGDFQDVRQAFIPTSQGRVPFLVPSTYAAAGLYYEVRDESQRVLANGNSNLRSLGK